jgi:hypothetical protein
MTPGIEIGDTCYGEDLDGQLFDTTHEPEQVEEIKQFLGEEWPNATGFIKTPEDGLSPVEIWMTDDQNPWSGHASFIRLR